MLLRTIMLTTRSFLDERKTWQKKKNFKYAHAVYSLIIHTRAWAQYALHYLNPRAYNAKKV